MILAQRIPHSASSRALVIEWDAVLMESLWKIDSGRGSFSRWLSLQFSVLSYSTVQPFISIFGLCLTQSLLCSIQPFYWARPVDCGSRRRANRLEKRSLSRPRHISLHHSHSAERRKVYPQCFPWPFFLLVHFPPPPHPPPPTLKPRGVSYKAVRHPHGH